MPRRLAVALLAAVLLALPAGPAGAFDFVEGLTEEADAVYEIRPDEGRVVVELRFSLTNTLTDVRSGNSIRYFFFDSSPVPLAPGATNITATSGETELGVELDGDVAVVDLGRQLRSGRTQELVITYEIPSAGPRSELGPWVDASGASLGAYAYGDPGLGSVTVTGPGDASLDSVLGELRRTRSDGTSRSLVATEIENSLEFFDVVVLDDPSELVASEVLVDDITVAVLSRPTDPEWTEFVTDRIGEAITNLEALAGRQFPEDSIEIAQSNQPALADAAGWYLQDGPDDVPRIEVVEDLDAHLLHHELAHAWVRTPDIVDIWVTEGLAEELASRAIELAGEESDTQPPAEPDADLPPLDTAFFGTAEQVLTAYDSSWWVFREFTDARGVDALTDLLVALEQGTVSYPGDDTTAIDHDAIDDWQRVLDLMEEAGWAEAPTVFEEIVVSPREIVRLNDRADARDRYGELLDEADGWAAPAGIRALMADWRFDDAETLIEEAQDVLAVRNRIATTAEVAGLATSDALEQRFETSDDLDGVLGAALAERDAVDAVAAGVRRFEDDRSRLERIGLWGASPETDLDRARGALAEGRLDDAIEATATAVDRLDEAERIGRERAIRAGAVLTVIALCAVGLVVRSRRRRRRRRDRAAAAREWAATEADALAEPVAES